MFGMNYEGRKNRKREKIERKKNKGDRKENDFTLCCLVDKIERK